MPAAVEVLLSAIIILASSKRCPANSISGVAAAVPHLDGLVESLIQRCTSAAAKEAWPRDLDSTTLAKSPSPSHTTVHTLAASTAPRANPSIHAPLLCSRVPAVRQCVVCGANEGVGSLVVFTDKHGRPALGAITGEETSGKKKASRWLTVDVEGETRLLTTREIRHVVPGGKSTALETIRIHEAEAQRAIEHDSESLPVLWETLRDESGGRAVPLTEMSDLLLGDTNSESCYATYKLLETAQGKTLFKGSGDGMEFKPRSPAERDALAELQAKETEAAEALQALRERVAASAMADDGPPFDLAAESAGVRKSFAAIMRLGSRAQAVMNREYVEAEATDDAARSLLTSLGRKGTEESARQLLVQLRLWSQHENLELIRRRMPTDFEDSLEELAAQRNAAPQPDPDADTRLDLTHLRALAIDEESTREVDDAISFETLPDGRVKLWVHVADPSRLLSPGDPLDLEARRRGSSSYLPTGTVPMFPWVLAEGAFSLRPGIRSCALSIGAPIELDGGFNDEEVVITPSTIVAERLTRDQFNQLLNESEVVTRGQDESRGELLSAVQASRKVASAREGYRILGGSRGRITSEELPDMDVVAWKTDGGSDEWEVQVSGTPSCAARRIVMEAMLFAGEAVAQYAASREIPLPYRSQSKKEEVSDEELVDWPSGPAGVWLANMKMRSSCVVPRPSPHEGLGLDAYVQVTSPIRRYADLAVHYQLKASLRSGPLPFPASPGGSSEIVRVAQEGGEIQNAVARAADRYWLREYLRRHAGEPFEAIVLGPGRVDNVHKVLLTSIGAIVDYERGGILTPGQLLEVRPSKLGDLSR